LPNLREDPWINASGRASAGREKLQKKRRWASAVRPAPLTSWPVTSIWSKLFIWTWRAPRERESPTGKGPASRLAIAIPRETRAARGVGGGRSQRPTCSSFRGQASRNTSGPDSLQASNSFFRFPPEIPHLNQTAHPKLSRSCHRVIGRCARSARAITRSAGNPHRAWCSRESGKPPRSAERSARRLSRPVVLADEVSRAPPRTSRN
jgi:hypothetical protein